MTAGLSALQGISQAATGSLVAAVWQGMALAAAVGLGLRLLPKTPAAVRFAIWFAVFAVVAGLPAIALWPHAAGAVQGSGRGPWLTLDARWSVAIAAAWALASLLRAATLAVAAFQVRALWKRAVPVEFDWASGLHPTHRDTAAIDGAPGLWLRGIVRKRQVQICSSEEVDRPSVIGFFAPKILIPRWLLEKLTAAELEQIVLHETGHLGRADDWLNLAQKIALAVFPLNPALAWVERRLCFERELACDERVLRACGRGAAKAYAACLAALAEHRLGRAGLALALGALGRESELGRRVREILGRAERMRPAQARLVLGGAVLGLVAGAVGLSRCPQLVGFSQMGASIQRPAQPSARGDNSTINVRRVDSYEPVVFRPDQARRMVAVEQNLGARTHVSEARRGAPASVAAQRQPAEAAVDAPIRRGGQSGEGAVGWVVVTTWEGADGSRLVLTAFDTAESPRSASPLPILDVQPIQVHPYAAVPLRDGWLVIQL